MALNGINSLVAVTQLKADAANTNASSQAAKQLGTMSAAHQALFAAADNFPQIKAASKGSLAAIRSKLDESTKDLESQDKLGNFEIQTLMSDYNEAQTTLSSLLRKTHDAAAAVIGKI